ncbi:ComEC/Rec2 family competence protein [Leptolyngbya sp. FACHB-261]|uniref:ComEC/Rec2 family competence protein n=1 Tax=Leptolyngbya sp. FACHB-261 TaxID=2692806 RepID=UPI001688095A|nr:ComEC/Rec2 family competence protein [Leptolyngbya sp. FACHB-261]MBD2101352.1 ComEC/Rec2 family competence protein [Leptolyngbya sp. FACHB-261]
MNRKVSTPGPPLAGPTSANLFLSFAYLAGLLATAIPAGGWLLLAAGLLAAFTLPQRWRRGPRRAVWLAAAVLACLASLYFAWRLPRPTASDLSRLAPQSDVVVHGEVTSLPHLTRSGRAQIWLQASRLEPLDSDPKLVTGQLYVTLPLTQATGLTPGQEIDIAGTLYQPSSARNPNGFDFQAYLARSGAFAGFSGRQVSIQTLEDKSEAPVSDVNPEPAPKKAHGLGWWQLQQHIVRTQVLGLGSPKGPLLSSLVLGSRAVDVPYDVRDQFVEAGLAHAFAASGFQVSLLLGLTLTLLRGRPPRLRLLAGLAILAIYPLLTGLSPSILRAAIMGLGALIALMRERKTQPLGSLLVAAVVLLLINPQWIWDLGFQLSFLATLGLLVSASPLSRALDWLPPTLASGIAVPLAAYLWTLPLQLFAFGKVAPYSLLTNVVATPLLAVATIGGMLSALVSLVSVWAGSAVAWLLGPVLGLLIAIVTWFNRLPGNVYAVGSISIVQVIALYGLLLLVWQQAWWRRRWALALTLAVLLVAVPTWYWQRTKFQVTLLAAERTPVMVIQDHGKTMLINSGDITTAALTVLPFLQKQGINQIDWAIATSPQANFSGGWEFLLQDLSVSQFRDGGFRAAPRTYQDLLTAIGDVGTGYQALQLGSTVSMGPVQVQLLSAEPLLLSLTLGDQVWLLLGSGSARPASGPAPASTATPVAPQSAIPQAKVLWWDGEALTDQILNAVHPEVAIASASTITAETSRSLQEKGIRVFWTGRDGALQWTPQRGFQTTLDQIEQVDAGAG